MIFRLILVSLIALSVYYYILVAAQLCGLLEIRGFEDIKKKFDFKYLIPFYQFYKSFKND